MHIKISVMLCLFVQTLLGVNELPKEELLKQQIGRMLVVGFEQSAVDENSQIVQDIQRYNLGGVILFDRFYKHKDKTKNIINAQQLQTLTQILQKYSSKPLLISIDQEGGKVQRLKERDGFMPTSSAQHISNLSLQTAKKQYDALALQLQQLGINVNFAPVVDLASNEDNVVIYKLQRSYGKDVSDVVAYAQTFMDALHEHDVLAVLKHFPGHGSSLQDSHKGFVDVSHTWRKKELEPYKELISNNDVQMIMTAHVFNANLDPTYPATLSYEVNTHLLREELGYKGVIISDDLQMDAILKHYTLDQTVRLAINSGIDILLFGNQLSSIATKKIVDTIYAQVLTDEISYERILKANERIDMLLKNVKK